MWWILWIANEVTMMSFKRRWWARTHDVVFLWSYSTSSLRTILEALPNTKKECGAKCRLPKICVCVYPKSKIRNLKLFHYSGNPKNNTKKGYKRRTNNKKGKRKGKAQCHAHTPHLIEEPLLLFLHSFGPCGCWLQQ